MHALVTAVIYFGTFITIGYAAKRLLDGWMTRHGETLTEVQAQGRDGTDRSHDRFLLGIWYKGR